MLFNSYSNYYQTARGCQNLSHAYPEPLAARKAGCRLPDFLFLPFIAAADKYFFQITATAPDAVTLRFHYQVVVPVPSHTDRCLSLPGGVPCAGGKFKETVRRHRQVHPAWGDCFLPCGGSSCVPQAVGQGGRRLYDRLPAPATHCAEGTHYNARKQ